MTVDFTLSDEQKELRLGAREFARTVVSGVKGAIANLDTPEARFYATRPFYRQAVEAGFIKGLIPVEDGGTYSGLLDQVIGGEEVASVDLSLPCTIFSVGLGLQPLLQFGTKEQRARLLAPFLDESRDAMAAFAFSEVGGSGSFDSADPSAGIQTTARREGDEWVINGRKQFTTNATGWDGKGAEVITVVCRTDLTRPPQESLAVVAVECPHPGVTFHGAMETPGHRGALSPIVHFDNVRVPVENMLGEPGDGLKILARTFSWTAPMVGVGSVGVMRAAFDCALEFARTDNRNGSGPVIDHQAVGFLLADMKMRLEACRYLTWKAAHTYDVSGGLSQELPVMSKVYCSETAVQVVYDAMRVVGIEAYSEKYPLAAILQDALALPLYDGGNLGIRRRQLHDFLRSEEYDALASAEGRIPSA
jgi:alkylation response protein AidB-like acyl-CoA dehydrogenase